MMARKGNLLTLTSIGFLLVWMYLAIYKPGSLSTFFSFHYVQFLLAFVSVLLVPGFLLDSLLRTFPRDKYSPFFYPGGWLALSLLNLVPFTLIALLFGLNISIISEAVAVELLILLVIALSMSQIRPRVKGAPLASRDLRHKPAVIVAIILVLLASALIMKRIGAEWQNDPFFHIGVVRLALEAPRWHPELNTFPGSSYAFPIWHFALAQLAFATDLDPLIIWDFLPSVIALVACGVWFDLGLSVTKKYSVAVATLLLIIFEHFHIGVIAANSSEPGRSLFHYFAWLPVPATLNWMILMPLILGLTFRLRKEESWGWWQLAAMVSALSLLMAAVHGGEMVMVYWFAIAYGVIEVFLNGISLRIMLKIVGPFLLSFGLFVLLYQVVINWLNPGDNPTYFQYVFEHNTQGGVVNILRDTIGQDVGNVLLVSLPMLGALFLSPLLALLHIDRRFKHGGAFLLAGIMLAPAVAMIPVLNSLVQTTVPIYLRLYRRLEFIFPVLIWGTVLSLVAALIHYQVKHWRTANKEHRPQRLKYLAFFLGGVTVTALLVRVSHLLWDERNFVWLSGSPAYFYMFRFSQLAFIIVIVAIVMIRFVFAKNFEAPVVSMMDIWDWHETKWGPEISFALTLVLCLFLALPGIEPFFQGIQTIWHPAPDLSNLTEFSKWRYVANEDLLNFLRQQTKPDESILTDRDSSKALGALVPRQMVSFPAIIDESAQRYLKQEGPAYVLLIRNPDNTPYPFFDLLEDYFESNEDVFTLLLSLEGGDILLYRINRKALPTN